MSKLAPVLRLIALAALMLLISAPYNLSAVFAGDDATPKVPSADSSEWTPENDQKCVPVPSEDGCLVVVNVFFSPFNAKGSGKNDTRRVTAAEDLAEEWNLPFTRVPITGEGSENYLLGFLYNCDGASNFQDACKGSLFVKILRKTKTGQWDHEWNRNAPWVRLPADMSPEVSKARQEAFFKKAFPNAPKAVALAKAERQKSLARVANANTQTVAADKVDVSPK